MSSPLSKPDIKNAQAGLYEIQQCKDEIEKMKACGLECGELEARALLMEQFFKGVQTHYAPNLR